MKKALATVLSALAQDPSLTIRDGDPVRHGAETPMRLGSRRNQILAGSTGGALVVAAAVAIWIKRRRHKAASPAVSAAPSTTPEPAAIPAPPSTPPSA